MKHKYPHKHYKHFSRKWKRLAIAVAGAALMSATILPGLPAATAHASPVKAAASSRTLQKAANTTRASEPEQENSRTVSQEIPLQSKSPTPQKSDFKQPKNNSSPQKQQQAENNRQTRQKAEDNTNTPTKVNNNPDKADDIAASPVEKTTKKSTPPAESKNNSSKENPAASENTPTNYKDVLDITATAYAPGPHDNEQWGSKTYSGTEVRPGIIAVDPKIIPLGSRVYIQYPDGHGTYATAEDTGGAIKGNRIDIAKWSVGEAEDFGIQQVKVYILDKPNEA
ncbi:MAG: 3D domain-containing protein [Veillonellales bacterium]